jgi:hypothetical protein
MGPEMCGHLQVNSPRWPSHTYPPPLYIMRGGGGEGDITSESGLNTELRGLSTLERVASGDWGGQG